MTVAGGYEQQHVVALGASAGGLEPLRVFFESMPTDSGVAFVVLQHLSPDHKSMMAELLGRETAMAVAEAQDGMELQPNTVTLLPPNRTMVIERGRIRLSDRSRTGGLSLPIDVFLGSLAESHGERAIAVILSGTGSDGTRGCRAVKEAGGLVIVQSAESARFDGMPRSAIAARCVDLVARPEEMSEPLLRYVRGERDQRRGPEGDASTAISEIFHHLLRTTGIDFSQYKRSTVDRRLQRRMLMTHCETVESYAELLLASSEEIEALFRELLIGVTRFFRDPDTWTGVETELIPRLLESLAPGDSLRMWVAGCSTGEEAYSLAMTVVETMERMRRLHEVKIFATDVDRRAIAFASAGQYPESIAADVNPERLARFFRRTAHGFSVEPSLRRMILFAPHDLIRDPPFTRIDLLTCRNVLIYFEPAAQQQVLQRMHFALRRGGLLWLGPSEHLGPLAGAFQTLDPRLKFHQRRGKDEGRREGLSVLAAVHRPRELDPPSEPSRATAARETLDAMQRVIALYAPTALLVDATHDLLHVFADDLGLLRMPPGPPTRNALQMLPRGLRAVLSTAIHKAIRDQSEVRYAGLRLEGHGSLLTVRLVPRSQEARDPSQILVLIERDASSPEKPGEDPTSAAADVEERVLSLSRELLLTKENLQATIEELETSNEELQATNEELIASNEELQSANEELQSVNEELNTLNAEFHAKILELTDVNNDLDNLIRAFNVGTLFLDEALRIRRFTPSLRQHINVLEQDVGRPLAHLSRNFVRADFLQGVERVLAEGGTWEEEVESHNGRVHQMRVDTYLDESGRRRGVVLSFTDVTEIRAATSRLQGVIDSLPEHVALLDPTGRILLVNRTWEEFALANGGVPERTGVGADYLAACESDPTSTIVAERVREVLRGERTGWRHRYPCATPAGPLEFLMQVVPMRAGQGAVVSHFDVTGLPPESTTSDARRALPPAEGAPE